MPSRPILLATLALVLLAAAGCANTNTGTRHLAPAMPSHGSEGPRVVARLTTPPPPADMPDTPDRMTIRFGSPRSAHPAAADLRQLAALLRTDPRRHVTLGGAAAGGPRRLLASARGDAIRTALLRAGVRPGQITIGSSAAAGEDLVVVRIASPVPPRQSPPAGPSAAAPEAPRQIAPPTPPPPLRRPANAAPAAAAAPPPPATRSPTIGPPLRITPPAPPTPGAVPQAAPQAAAVPPDQMTIRFGNPRSAHPAAADLRQLAALLRADPRRRVTLSGAAGGTGDSRQLLASARVEVVRVALLRSGAVRPGQIVIGSSPAGAGGEDLVIARIAPRMAKRSAPPFAFGLDDASRPDPGGTHGFRSRPDPEGTHGFRSRPDPEGTHGSRSRPDHQLQSLNDCFVLSLRPVYYSGRHRDSSGHDGRR